MLSITASIAGEPRLLIHPALASCAPQALQNAASATVIGWPHCEQNRARVDPASAMEHERRVTQANFVAVSELLRPLHAPPAQESAVLTRQIAQYEPSVLRDDARVAPRH